MSGSINQSSLDSQHHQRPIGPSAPSPEHLKLSQNPVVCGNDLFYRHFMQNLLKTLPSLEYY